jgi:hypothetical protein
MFENLKKNAFSPYFSNDRKLKNDKFFAHLLTLDEDTPETEK